MRKFLITAGLILFSTLSIFAAPVYEMKNGRMDIYGDLSLYPSTATVTSNFDVRKGTITKCSQANINIANITQLNVSSMSVTNTIQSASGIFDNITVTDLSAYKITVSSYVYGVLQSSWVASDFFYPYLNTRMNFIGGSDFWNDIKVNNLSPISGSNIVIDANVGVGKIPSYRLDVVDTANFDKGLLTSTGTFTSNLFAGGKIGIGLFDVSSIDAKFVISHTTNTEFIRLQSNLVAGVNARIGLNDDGGLFFDNGLSTKDMWFERTTGNLVVNQKLGVGKSPVYSLDVLDTANFDKGIRLSTATLTGALSGTSAGFTGLTALGRVTTQAGTQLLVDCNTIGDQTLAVSIVKGSQSLNLSASDGGIGYPQIYWTGANPLRILSPNSSVGVDVVNGKFSVGTSTFVIVNGNVHIGNGLLSIFKAAEDAQLKLMSDGTNETVANGAIIKYDAATANLHITPRTGYSTIFTAGNVGVSTDAPSNTFHVKGSVRIQNSSSLSSMYFSNDGTYSKISDQNDDRVVISNSSGYVGIGKLPSYRLDVAGTANFDSGILTSNVYTTGTSTFTNTVRVIIGGTPISGSDSNDVLILQNTFSSGDSVGLQLFSGATGESRINFGNTGEKQRGLISYDRNVDRFRIGSKGTTVALLDYDLTLYYGAIFNNTNSARDFQVKGQTNDNMFYADTSLNSIGMGKLPSYSLDVAGTANFDLGLRTSTTTVTGLLQGNYANFSSYIESSQVYDTSDYRFYADLASGTTSLLVSGSIGVGLPAGVGPEYKLHVRQLSGGLTAKFDSESTSNFVELAANGAGNGVTLGFWNNTTGGREGYIKYVFDTDVMSFRADGYERFIISPYQSIFTNGLTINSTATIVSSEQYPFTVTGNSGYGIRVIGNSSMKTYRTEQQFGFTGDGTNSTTDNYGYYTVIRTTGIDNGKTYTRIYSRAGSGIPNATGLVISPEGYIGLNQDVPTTILDIKQMADSAGIKISGYDDLISVALQMGVAADGVCYITPNNGLRINNVLLPQNGAQQPNNTVYSFGDGSNYSIGYYNPGSQFQLVQGATLNSNVIWNVSGSSMNVVSGLFSVGGSTLTVSNGVTLLGVITSPTGMLNIDRNEKGFNLMLRDSSVSQSDRLGFRVNSLGQYIYSEQSLPTIFNHWNGVGYDEPLKMTGSTGLMNFYGSTMTVSRNGTVTMGPTSHFVASYIDSTYKIEIGNGRGQIGASDNGLHAAIKGYTSYGLGLWANGTDNNGLFINTNGHGIFSSGITVSSATINGPLVLQDGTILTSTSTLGGSGISSIPIKDEGLFIMNATTFNFTGSGVTTSDGGNGVVTVNISGSGSGDMLKSVYDTGDNGIVDNSERLAGYTTNYFTMLNNTVNNNGKLTLNQIVDSQGIQIFGYDDVSTSSMQMGVAADGVCFITPSGGLNINNTAIFNSGASFPSSQRINFGDVSAFVLGEKNISGTRYLIFASSNIGANLDGGYALKISTGGAITTGSTLTTGGALTVGGALSVSGNINLGGNYLSYDGSATGLQINSVNQTVTNGLVVKAGTYGYNLIESATSVDTTPGAEWIINFKNDYNSNYGPFEKFNVSLNNTVGGYGNFDMNWYRGIPNTLGNTFSLTPYMKVGYDGIVSFPEGKFSIGGTTVTVSNGYVNFGKGTIYPDTNTQTQAYGNYSTTFTSNTTNVSGILHVTHNLNSQYNAVAIYDNNDRMILPDDINAYDVNKTSVTFTSFGSFAGTWKIKIIR